MAKLCPIGYPSLVKAINNQPKNYSVRENKLLQACFVHCIEIFLEKNSLLKLELDDLLVNGELVHRFTNSVPPDSYKLLRIIDIFSN